jgi:hypothetical protein
MINISLEKIEVGLKAGEYEATVTDSILKTSGNGNEMIQIELFIDDEGQTYNVRDFFVISNARSINKLVTMVESSGKTEMKSLTDPEQLLGLEVTVLIAKDGDFSKVVEYIGKKEDILF